MRIYGLVIPELLLVLTSEIEPIDLSMKPFAVSGTKLLCLFN